MELNSARWLTIATLACATLAVWQMPESSGDGLSSRTLRPPTGWHSYALGAMEDRLMKANTRLRALEIRDSVVAADVRSRARTTGLSVSIDRRFADWYRAAVDSGIHRYWAGLGADAKVPVVVAVVLDTGRHAHDLPEQQTGSMSYVFLPDRSTLGACLVIVRAPNSMQRVSQGERRRVLEWQTSSNFARSLFGPCALYAAFGPPGAGIERWLRTTGWESAQAVSWQKPSFSWWENSRLSDNDPLSAFFGFNLVQQHARNFLSEDAIACIGGRPQRCATALVAPVDDSDGAWQGAVVEPHGNYYAYIGAWFFWGKAELGPGQGWIVSDMVNALGRERFAKFWASSLGPGEAYRAATGEELAPWVERWAQKMYGTDTIGPQLPMDARLGGILVALAGLGVAMVFGVERRVA